MPLSQNPPSKEAREDQQGSQALRTNDVPTGSSNTDAGWLREFTEGQEIAARVLFNQGYIAALEKAWERKDAEDSKEPNCPNYNQKGNDAHQSTEDEDTDDCKEHDSTDPSTEGKYIFENEDDDENNSGEDPDESDEEEDDDDDDDEDAAGEEIKLETSIAKVFLRSNLHEVKHETTEPWPKGIGCIEEYCAHIQFEDMKKLNPNAKPIAIVEENSRSGVYRNNRRPLNLFRLRTLLQQPRYEEFADETSQRPPNVDQRRLCILGNLPETTAVLMENCSSNDAAALAELFYLHLNRNPSVGVSIPPRSVRQFTFRLSLPFYKAISNIRPNRGSSQKKILSIPHLGDFVVGQYTVILTGVDEQRWTAIAVIDGSNRNAAKVDHNYTHFTKGLRKDPITGTDYFSLNTSHHARTYFPWLWKALIDEAVRDWTEVVDVIKAHIHKKDEKDALLFNSTKPGAIDQLMASIATGAQWDYMLTPMHTELSGMLRAFEQFQTCRTKYFNDATIPSDDIFATRNNFPGIQDKYDDLATLHNLLGDLITSLRRPQLNNVRDARMRDLGLRERRIHAKTNEGISKYAAKSQRKAAKKAINAHETMAKSAWKSTVTTIALLPCMLVFTAFSMEKSAMPVEASFKMLLYGLGVFTAGTVVLFNFLDILLSLVNSVIGAVLSFLMPKAGMMPERELEDSAVDSDDSDFEFDR